MTGIIVECKTNPEGKGIDFNVKLTQNDEATNEEKMAALYLLPFVKKAFEEAMLKADEEQKKVDASAENSSIITP